MTAAQAFARIMETGRAFDDPHSAHVAVRWYFGADGVLRREPWRCSPTSYPEFSIDPERVKFGAVPDIREKAA